MFTYFGIFLLRELLSDPFLEVPPLLDLGLCFIFSCDSEFCLLLFSDRYLLDLPLLRFF
jgi:hypothetical protein